METNVQIPAITYLSVAYQSYLIHILHMKITLSGRNNYFTQESVFRAVTSSEHDNCIKSQLIYQNQAIIMPGFLMDTQRGASRFYFNPALAGHPAGN